MGKEEQFFNDIKKRMLAKYPRFGAEVAQASLSFRTDLPSQTAATDGKNIYFDPDFMAELSEDERLFVIAHEMMHIKFEHMYRMLDKDGKRRDPRLWNIATDAIINANLERDGFTIKEGAINMPEALDYSAEEFYEKLLKEQEEKRKAQQQENFQNSQSQSGSGKGNQDEQQSSEQQGSGQQNESQQQENPQSGENGSQNQTQNNQQNGNNDAGANENEQDGRALQSNNDFTADDHSLWEEALNKRLQEQNSQKQNEKQGQQNNAQESNERQEQDKNQRKQPSAKNLFNKFKHMLNGKQEDSKKYEKSQKEEKSQPKNEDNQQNMSDLPKEAVKNIVARDYEARDYNERDEFQQNRVEKRERAKQNFAKFRSEEMKNIDSGLSMSDIGTAESILDWKMLLRREVEKNETIWSQRRSVAENNYAYRLEDYDDEDEAETEVMIDVSGSVPDELVISFVRQLKHIIKSSKLKIGFFADYATTEFVEIKKERDIDQLKIARPGFGTNYDSAVRAFSNKHEVNKIVFTDGDFGNMPKQDLKGKNVIWLVYYNRDFNPCCGKVIDVYEKDFVNTVIARDR